MSEKKSQTSTSSTISTNKNLNSEILKAEPEQIFEPEGTNIHGENRVESAAPTRSKLFTWLAVLVAVLVVGSFVLWWMRAGKPVEAPSAKVETAADSKDDEAGLEVKLEPEALQSTGVQIEGVTQRPAVAPLRVTGTVELNPQQTQEITPLVGGRVESVRYGVGDHVNKGAVLATIVSPTVAELHGKLREAETREKLARANLARIQKAENRASIIEAKARLDEAEATLKRTMRLIELGAGAGKDRTAAETMYKTAKADYDFQSNIVLNKELQESQAEVETAKVESNHLRNQLNALGVQLPVGGHENDTVQNIALVMLRAPASGMITERKVNAGAGVSEGSQLFTISGLSSLFIIANVPQTQMSLLRVGTPAEVHSPATSRAIYARITYIDPQLSEDTRTGRVRLEVSSKGGELKAGMFVDIDFQAGTGAATGEEIVVPSTAVQRLGEKTIVFIPKEDESGAFAVREIEIGGEVEQYTRVIKGLAVGEKVVTRGSFILKAQLQKGELGED